MQPGAGLDIRQVLRKHDITFAEQVKPYGTVLRLDRCLTSIEHTDGACLIEFSNGALYYKCHHASCSDKGWPDAKATLGLGLSREDDASTDVDSERFTIVYDDEIENLPPPQWLVEDYLPTDSIAALVGPSEAGKSFLCIDLAMAIATGTDWHGQKVRRGTVVYAAAEGASGMGARVRAWKQEHGVSGRLGVGFMFKEVNFLNDNERDAYIARLEQLPEPPALVIVDTFAWAMAGGDENQVKDVMKAMEGIKRIRQQLKSTVLVVHHTTKNGDQERGSSSFRNAMDSMLLLTQEKGVITLEVTKQKDAPKPKPRQFCLRGVQLRTEGTSGEGDDLIVDLDTSCVFEDLVANPTDEPVSLLTAAEKAMLAALRFLNDAEGPAGATAWQKVSEVSDGTFYRTRPTLIFQHFVQSTGGTRPRYTITDAGREALQPLKFSRKGPAHAAA